MVIKITVGFTVSWFQPLPTLGLQNDCKFHGFVVSLFCALLFWNIVMKIRDGEDETKKPRNLSSSDVPYSIMHIGIGSWLRPYVVFMMTDHVPYYQSIPTSPILNHAYWYWVLARAMCCFMMTDHVISYQSIIHTQSHILVLGLGLGHVLFHDDRPCTILSKHTSITHTQSCILVLGLGLGHVFFHDD